MNPKTVLVCCGLIFHLAGCGIETASTAATAAQLKAKEAEQAQKQLEAAKKQIEEAQQLTTQRIQEAEQAADKP